MHILNSTCGCGDGVVGSFTALVFRTFYWVREEAIGKGLRISLCISSCERMLDLQYLFKPWTPLYLPMKASMGCSGLAVSDPAQAAPPAGEELLYWRQPIRSAPGFLQDPSRYCTVPVTSLCGRLMANSGSPCPSGINLGMQLQWDECVGFQRQCLICSQRMHTFVFKGCLSWAQVSAGRWVATVQHEWGPHDHWWWERK